MQVKVEVKNLNELVLALRDNAGLAKPMEQAFKRIGLEQVSASRRGAPVDTGLLRNRITYEVDSSPFPNFVRVGTIGKGGANYAAYMEFGTGMAHDHPNWPKKPHEPSPAALQKWAQRKSRGPKNFNAFSVAAAITKRGGLEPRRYLRGPFERNQRKYVMYLTDALRRASLRG